MISAIRHFSAWIQSVQKVQVKSQRETIMHTLICLNNQLFSEKWGGYHALLFFSCALLITHVVFTMNNSNYLQWILGKCRRTSAGSHTTDLHFALSANRIGTRRIDKLLLYILHVVGEKAFFWIKWRLVVKSGLIFLTL